MIQPYTSIPWEDRPAGCSDVVWRYSQNPIIPRDLIPTSNSIFNSAVVPFNGEFRGVFRADNKKREMNLHSGSSKDGFNFTLSPDPIEWIHDDPELAKFEYRYDPRVTWIEDRFYVSWCNGFHGPTIGIGYTYDFEKFHFLENALFPFNRNGVLFPRRINGKYVMLSRPSDNGHTPFGNIYLSQSPDMIHWGEHRFVMGTKDGWQSTKIGAGPTPIETKEGWLIVLPRRSSRPAMVLCTALAPLCSTWNNPGKSFTAVPRICCLPRRITSVWEMSPMSRSPVLPYMKNPQARSPSIMVERIPLLLWLSARLTRFLIFLRKTQNYKIKSQKEVVTSALHLRDIGAK